LISRMLAARAPMARERLFVGVVAQRSIATMIQSTAIEAAASSLAGGRFVQADADPPTLPDSHISTGGAFPSLA